MFANIRVYFEDEYITYIEEFKLPIPHSAECTRCNHCQSQLSPVVIENRQQLFAFHSVIGDYVFNLGNYLRDVLVNLQKLVVRIRGILQKRDLAMKFDHKTHPILSRPPSSA